MLCLRLWTEYGLSKKMGYCFKFQSNIILMKLNNTMTKRIPLKSVVNIDFVLWLNSKTQKETWHQLLKIYSDKYNNMVITVQLYYQCFPCYRD